MNHKRPDRPLYRPKQYKKRQNYHRSSSSASSHSHAPHVHLRKKGHYRPKNPFVDAIKQLLATIRNDDREVAMNAFGELLRKLESPVNRAAFRREFKWVHAALEQLCHDMSTGVVVGRKLAMLRGALVVSALPALPKRNNKDGANVLEYVCKSLERLSSQTSNVTSFYVNEWKFIHYCVAHVDDLSFARDTKLQDILQFKHALCLLGDGGAGAGVTEDQPPTLNTIGVAMSRLECVVDVVELEVAVDVIHYFGTSFPLEFNPFFCDFTDIILGWIFDDDSAPTLVRSLVKKLSMFTTQWIGHREFALSLVLRFAKMIRKLLKSVPAHHVGGKRLSTVKLRRLNHLLSVLHVVLATFGDAPPLLVSKDNDSVKTIMNQFGVSCISLLSLLSVSSADRATLSVTALSMSNMVIQCMIAQLGSEVSAYVSWMLPYVCVQLPHCGDTTNDFISTIDAVLRLCPTEIRASAVEIVSLLLQVPSISFPVNSVEWLIPVNSDTAQQFLTDTFAREYRVCTNPTLCRLVLKLVQCVVSSSVVLENSSAPTMEEMLRNRSIGSAHMSSAASPLISTVAIRRICGELLDLASRSKLTLNEQCIIAFNFHVLGSIVSSSHAGLVIVQLVQMYMTPTSILSCNESLCVLGIQLLRRMETSFNVLWPVNGSAHSMNVVDEPLRIHSPEVCSDDNRCELHRLRRNHSMVGDVSLPNRIAFVQGVLLTTYSASYECVACECLEWLHELVVDTELSAGTFDDRVAGKLCSLTNHTSSRIRLLSGEVLYEAFAHLSHRSQEHVIYSTLDRLTDVDQRVRTVYSKLIRLASCVDQLVSLSYHTSEQWCRRSKFADTIMNMPLNTCFKGAQYEQCLAFLRQAWSSPQLSPPTEDTAIAEKWSAFDDVESNVHDRLMAVLTTGHPSNSADSQEWTFVLQEASQSWDATMSWMCLESAKYLIRTRLKTPHGNPIQTLERLESHLVEMIKCARHPWNKSGAVLQVSVLEALEKYVYNIVYGVHNVQNVGSVVFFQTNHKSVTIFFARLRHRLVVASRVAGMHLSVLYHGQQYFELLRDPVRTANVFKRGVKIDHTREVWRCMVVAAVAVRDPGTMHLLLDVPSLCSWYSCVARAVIPFLNGQWEEALPPLLHCVFEAIVFNTTNASIGDHVIVASVFQYLGDNKAHEQWYSKWCLIRHILQTSDEMVVMRSTVSVRDWSLVVEFVSQCLSALRHKSLVLQWHQDMALVSHMCNTSASRYVQGETYNEHVVAKLSDWHMLNAEHCVDMCANMSNLHSFANTLIQSEMEMSAHRSQSQWWALLLRSPCLEKYDAARATLDREQGERVSSVTLLPADWSSLYELSSDSSSFVCRYSRAMLATNNVELSKRLLTEVSQPNREFNPRLAYEHALHHASGIHSLWNVYVAVMGVQIPPEVVSAMMTSSNSCSTEVPPVLSMSDMADRFSGVDYVTNLSDCERQLVVLCLYQMLLRTSNRTSDVHVIEAEFTELDSRFRRNHDADFDAADVNAKVAAGDQQEELRDEMEQETEVDNDDDDDDDDDDGANNRRNDGENDDNQHDHGGKKGMAAKELLASLLLEKEASTNREVVVGEDTNNDGANGDNTNNDDNSNMCLGVDMTTLHEYCWRTCTIVQPLSPQIVYEYAWLCYTQGLSLQRRNGTESSKLSVHYFRCAGMELLRLLKASHKSPYGELRVVLLLLKLVTSQSALHDAEILSELTSTPGFVWTPIIPQIVARLCHPSSMVRSALAKILVNAAESTPNGVIFPVVAALGSTSARARAKHHVLSEILHALRKQDNEWCKRVEMVEVLSSELQQLGEFPEDSWMHFFHHLQLDLNSRIRLIADVQQHSVVEDDNSHEEEENTLYSFVMSPVVMHMKMLLDETVENPTNQHAHGSNFCAMYGKALKELVDEVCTPSESWQSLWSRVSKHIHVLKNKWNRQSIVPLARISPWLARLDECVQLSNEQMITGLLSDVVIMRTKTRPKKIGFRCTDGHTCHYLVKAREDLRLDERVMQILNSTNALLHKVRVETSRWALGSDVVHGCGKWLYDDVLLRHRSAVINDYELSAVTYAVLPLSERCGMICWVNSMTPLIDLHTEWRNRLVTSANNSSNNNNNNHNVEYNTLTPVEAFKRCVRLVLTEKGLSVDTPRRHLSTEVLQTVFDRLCSVRPSPQALISNEFWAASTMPSQWWFKSRQFQVSVAVMCMMGYVLGLGDRHLGNILLDVHKGKVLHIDYNVCFEKGLRLPVPEIVPFRLTRIIQGGLGSLAGLFRSACVVVLSLLRQHSFTMLALLDAFVYDPLIEWTAEVGSKPTDVMVMNSYMTLTLLRDRLNECGAEFVDVHTEMIPLLKQLDIYLEELSLVRNLEVNNAADARKLLDRMQLELSEATNVSSLLQAKRDQLQTDFDDAGTMRGEHLSALNSRLQEYESVCTRDEHTIRTVHTGTPECLSRKFCEIVGITDLSMFVPAATAPSNHLVAMLTVDQMHYTSHADHCLRVDTDELTLRTDALMSCHLLLQQMQVYRRIITFSTIRSYLETSRVWQLKQELHGIVEDPSRSNFSFTSLLGRSGDVHNATKSDGSKLALLQQTCVDRETQLNSARQELEAESLCTVANNADSDGAARVCEALIQFGRKHVNTTMPPHHFDRLMKLAVGQLCISVSKEIANYKGGGDGVLHSVYFNVDVVVGDSDTTIATSDTRVSLINFLQLVVSSFVCALKDSSVALQNVVSSKVNWSPMETSELESLLGMLQWLDGEMSDDGRMGATWLASSVNTITLSATKFFESDLTSVLVDNVKRVCASMELVYNEVNDVLHGITELQQATLVTSTSSDKQSFSEVLKSQGRARKRQEKMRSHMSHLAELQRQYVALIGESEKHDDPLVVDLVTAVNSAFDSLSSANINARQSWNSAIQESHAHVITSCDVSVLVGDVPEFAKYDTLFACRLFVMLHVLRLLVDYMSVDDTSTAASDDIRDTVRAYLASAIPKFVLKVVKQHVVQVMNGCACFMLLSSSWKPASSCATPTILLQRASSALSASVAGCLPRCSELQRQLLSAHRNSQIAKSKHTRGLNRLSCAVNARTRALNDARTSVYLHCWLHGIQLVGVPHRRSFMSEMVDNLNNLSATVNAWMNFEAAVYRPLEDRLRTSACEPQIVARRHHFEVQLDLCHAVMELIGLIVKLEESRETDVHTNEHAYVQDVVTKFVDCCESVLTCQTHVDSVTKALEDNEVVVVRLSVDVDSLRALVESSQDAELQRSFAIQKEKKVRAIKKSMGGLLPQLVSLRQRYNKIVNLVVPLLGVTCKCEPLLLKQAAAHSNSNALMNVPACCKKYKKEINRLVAALDLITKQRNDAWKVWRGYEYATHCKHVLDNIVSLKRTLNEALDGSSSDSFCLRRSRGGGGGGGTFAGGDELPSKYAVGVTRQVIAKLGGDEQVEVVVDRLVNEATDRANLCRLYEGWAPFI